MPTAAPSSSPAAADRTKGLAVHGGTPVRKSPVPLISAGLAPEDIEAATAVLKSGMLRQGARCAELEKAFGALTDAKHALTCANGTCALQLAYEPLVRPGDDVLVPAWTYIATASMIVARGARPVFVESDPDTMCIDVADAERRITPRTTAIAATHLYGNPVNIDGVQALAAKKGLKVVYDAAQAHLATYRGKGLGAYGDAVTYSFYATKNISTGEGGMVTVNDDDLAHKIAMLRSHGESGKYLHDSVGYNYRMTDVEGAIGFSQLGRAPTLTARRRENAQKLDAIIAGIDGLKAPKVTPGAEHAYHLYTVRMDADRFACSRDEFIAALQAEGVQCAVHYPRSLTRQPAFKDFVTGHLPGADKLAATVFCIPVHPALTERDIADTGEALAKVADAYRR